MSDLRRRLLERFKLGDKVDAVTTATGIKRVVERVHGKPCSACARRKKILNGEKVG